MKYKYGIFDRDGNLDTDPEPMVFYHRNEATEFLQECTFYERGDGWYVGLLDPISYPQFYE